MDDNECVLCRKPKLKAGLHGQLDWRKICTNCVKLWELGKKTVILNKAEQGDGKLGYASVILVFPTDGRQGEPGGATEFKSADIIAAMGAVKLKGTSLNKRFSQPEGTVVVGDSINKDANAWNFTGGRELVSVPTSRAQAMRKILGCVFNAIAQARIDGFNEGRNLLKGLATGSVTIDDFTEQSDEAAEGRRPRYRF